MRKRNNPVSPITQVFTQAPAQPESSSARNIAGIAAIGVGVYILYKYVIGKNDDDSTIPPVGTWVDATKKMISIPFVVGVRVPISGDWRDAYKNLGERTFTITVKESEFQKSGYIAKPIEANYGFWVHNQELPIIVEPGNTIEFVYGIQNTSIKAISLGSTIVIEDPNGSITRLVWGPGIINSNNGVTIKATNPNKLLIPGSYRVYVTLWYSVDDPEHLLDFVDLYPAFTVNWEIAPPAYNPVLTILNNYLYFSETLNYSFSGFTPNSEITVSIQGVSYMSLVHISNSKGTGSGSMIMNILPGDYILTAKDNYGNIASSGFHLEL